MKLEEAIKVIEEYNLWRKGREDFFPNPKKVTIALERIVSELKAKLEKDEQEINK